MSLSPALATIPGVISLGAFQAGDDNNRIVLAGTNNGSIHEIFYHPSRGVSVTNPPLAQIADLTAVSGYYTPSDGRRHVIATTANGSVFETFYGGGEVKGQGLLKKFGQVGVTRVEVTQALQDLDNSIPLFKGKRTLVRVYLNGGSCSRAAELTDVSVSAAVFPAGNSVTPVWGPLTIGPATAPTAISRDTLTHSLNFELPPEGAFFHPWATDKDYVLRITPQPTQDTGEPYETRLRLYESVPFHIRVFFDTASGNRVPRAAVDQAVNRLRAIYPVRDVIVHDFNDAQAGIGWDTLGLWRALAQMGDQAAINDGREPPNCSSCFFITIPWVAAGSVPFGLANPWPNHDSQVAMDPTDINWTTGTLAQEPRTLGRLHASSSHNDSFRPIRFPLCAWKVSDNADLNVGNITTRGKFWRGSGTNPAPERGVVADPLTTPQTARIITISRAMAHGSISGRRTTLIRPYAAPTASGGSTAGISRSPTSVPRPPPAPPCVDPSALRLGCAAQWSAPGPYAEELSLLEASTRTGERCSDRHTGCSCRPRFPTPVTKSITTTATFPLRLRFSTRTAWYWRANPCIRLRTARSFRSGFACLGMSAHARSSSGATGTKSLV
jgi:hypothetical protein